MTTTVRDDETQWWGICNKCSAAAELGDCLATIDMDQNVGAAVPPFLGVGGIGEGPKLKQLQGTSTDAEWTGTAQPP